MLFGGVAAGDALLLYAGLLGPGDCCTLLNCLGPTSVPLLGGWGTKGCHSCWLGCFGPAAAAAAAGVDAAG